MRRRRRRRLPTVLVFADVNGFRFLFGDDSVTSALCVLFALFGDVSGFGDGDDDGDGDVGEEDAVESARVSVSTLRVSRGCADASV